MSAPRPDWLNIERLDLTSDTPEARYVLEMIARGEYEQVYQYQSSRLRGGTSRLPTPPNFSILNLFIAEEKKEIHDAGKTKAGSFLGVCEVKSNFAGESEDPSRLYQWYLLWMHDHTCAQGQEVLPKEVDFLPLCFCSKDENGWNLTLENEDEEKDVHVFLDFMSDAKDRIDFDMETELLPEKFKETKIPSILTRWENDAPSYDKFKAKIYGLLIQKELKFAQ